MILRSGARLLPKLLVKVEVIVVIIELWIHLRRPHSMTSSYCSRSSIVLHAQHSIMRHGRSLGEVLLLSSPVLKPDLNGSISHAQLAGELIAHTRIRCRVHLKCFFQDSQLLRCRARSFTRLLLLLWLPVSAFTIIRTRQPSFVIGHTVLGKI